MERLASRIANKIALELSYKDEQKQVIEYGLIALLQTLFMTAIVLLLGSLFNIVIESMILCFAISILRKYSGGAHAGSIASCTIIGVVICVVFGMAMKYLGSLTISPVLLMFVIILVFVYALIIALRKAPIDSPNKKIRSEQKRKKMKDSTIILLLVYFLISMVFLFYINRSSVFSSALLSLLLSVVWQISSLTNPGKFVLEGLDRLVYRIISFGRRT